MLENKMYLQFKDNTKKIEFDLNNNTVFFGNNGQGKTRILKTINSLYLMAKEKKIENLSKIIDSMNLKTLKVNGVDYRELFTVNENLKETEKQKILIFIKENNRYFRELYSLIQDIPDEVIYYSGDRIRFKNIFRNLRAYIYISPNNKVGPRLEEFNRWLVDIYVFMMKLRNNIHHKLDFDSLENENSLLTNIERAINLISYLRDKYQFLAVYSEEEELISRMERNKEEVLKSLSIKSAHYITTDNMDITNIAKKLELSVEQINNELKEYFWSKSMNLNNLDRLASLIEKKNVVHLKIKKFNTVMKKYTNIKIDFQQNNALVFIKNNEEMAFEKLSSGEKKVAFLFLEIIFNEVDIYLIDEPELSLSLNFQNKIITDLHLLTKSKTLFVATHAPYIYEDFIAIEGNTSKEV